VTGIWFTYLAAAIAASVVFVVAGWRSKKAHSFTSARVGHEMPIDPLWDEAEIDPSEARPQADAGAALRTALRHLAPVMANRSIQADVAAGFGLMVQMTGPALADLLEEIIGAAINAAPASRILLTAAPHDGQVVICVTDDMPNADPDVRRAGVRSLTQRVAGRGGALDVAVRPYEGTTITLRLAAAVVEQPDTPPPAPFGKPGLVPAVSYGMTR